MIVPDAQSALLMPILYAHRSIQRTEGVVESTTNEQP